MKFFSPCVAFQQLYRSYIHLPKKVLPDSGHSQLIIGAETFIHSEAENSAGKWQSF